jgi:succinate dehydrogenase / fumarate reductase, iron-sulfur subunit
MDLTLKIWRQKDAKSKGKFETYKISGISADCSFLEMLDLLNEKLIGESTEPVEFTKCPVSFDHDCREGICGMCGLFINGRPHGPDSGITTCQLHMRKFKDGDTIVIEPWRSRAFPIIRDLLVDRSAFDKVIQAGGYVSVNTGGIPDANSIPVSKRNADLAMDAAACIGCGACVAACANASAMLFVSAKVSQLALLPQGKIEAKERVQKMVKRMDELGFGNCSNTYACEAECPKLVNRSNIARMNREFISAKTCYEKEMQRMSGGA